MSELTGKFTRRYAGSTRPPGVDATLWSKWYTRKDKQKAIEEYLASLSHDRAASSGGTTPAAAGPPTSQKPRRIVELCTSEDSAIGIKAPAGCEVVRITKADDLLSKTGMAKACKAAAYDGVLVVIALDCIGGCGWQHVNKNKEGGPERIAAHRAEFFKMLKAAKCVAAIAQNYDGSIWFELGNSNAYWQEPLVHQFCDRFNVERVRIDGCRFGLRGKETVSYTHLTLPTKRIV